MLIDDIDFADLYLQQLRLAHRTEKTPDHWDQRAEKMAENCASPTDSYLQQLTSKIDLYSNYVNRRRTIRTVTKLSFSKEL